ncbi:MAG: hypothetical protein F4X55_05105 [Candidatus Dadabacteria bacterium]|nr:hypothetical protein [Candidatus Dadabacteria bacterium]
MSLDPKELTGCLKEVQKAQKSLDHLLDFVDLMKNVKESFPGDVATPAEKIREISSTVAPYIKEIKAAFDEELNKVPINDEEVEDAAKKLVLYHGDHMQVLIWAEQQKANHEPDSYWWKYWNGITENVKKDMAEHQKQL